MKIWAIFPTVCFLILFLTIFSLLEFPRKKKFQIILSFALTSIVTTWTVLHIEKLFNLVYHINFILAILNIPALTYLLDQNLSKGQNNNPVLRLFLLILLAIAFTFVFFVTMFIISMGSGGYEH